jgi:PTH1 family peptidyl-tRNA hydrolase
MKTGGGHGGHNGLRSITSQITDGYRRVRLGIGHPGVKELVHGHVLSDFAKADAAWLDPLLDAVADNADALVGGDDTGFANRVHLVTDPRPPRSPKASPAAAPGPAADAEGAATGDGPTPNEANGMAARLRALLEGKPPGRRKGPR